MGNGYYGDWEEPNEYDVTIPPGQEVMGERRVYPEFFRNILRKYHGQNVVSRFAAIVFVPGVMTYEALRLVKLSGEGVYRVFRERREKKNGKLENSFDE